MLKGEKEENEKAMKTESRVHEFSYVAR